MQTQNYQLISSLSLLTLGAGGSVFVCDGGDVKKSKEEEEEQQQPQDDSNDTV